MDQKQQHIYIAHNIMIDFITLPFIQRALIAGVIMAVVLGYLGVFVVLRRMAFFGSGVAHASLSGVAAGLLAGWYPLYTALMVGVLFAVLVYYLERKSDMSGDTIIGMLFAGGMALGVVLMSLGSGYQPELMSFLFGNILAIIPQDLYVIGGLSVASFIFFFVYRREMTLLALDTELAHVSGVNTERYLLIMYILLAIVVVLGIKVVGVVLVSALLTIPVSSGRLIARSFRELTILTILISVVGMVAGIVVSYVLNLPMGPTIVLTSISIFFGIFLIRRRV